MAVYYGLYFGWLGIDVSRNPKLCSGKKEKNVKYARPVLNTILVKNIGFNFSCIQSNLFR